MYRKSFNSRKIEYKLDLRFVVFFASFRFRNKNEKYKINRIKYTRIYMLYTS